MGCKEDEDKPAQPTEVIKISLNQQRSLLRATSDNALTAALDQVDGEEDARVIRGKVKEIAIQVDEFLQTGDVCGLTAGEIRIELLKLIPAQYKQIVDQLLSAISPLHIAPSGKIGVNNVKRLRAVCQGAIDGADYYRMEDRAGIVEDAGTPSPMLPVE
jgi:hypothetical protein